MIKSEDVAIMSESVMHNTDEKKKIHFFCIKVHESTLADGGYIPNT